MTRNRLSSQEAVQYILGLPSGSEMSDLDDELSEDEIDLDSCNAKVLNIEENEEEDIVNNDNDKDLEVQNNESIEAKRVMMGEKNKMTILKVKLEINRMMNKSKTFSKVTSMSHT